MSTEFNGEAIRWKLHDKVVEVTLDRAPANEIGTLSLGELEGLAAFVRDGAGGARAMLFHSARPAAFCAGADLRELYAGITEARAQGATPGDLKARVRDFLDRIHRVYDTFDQAPLTTIAAVHGVTFGGGFELALTADVIVADKSARFCFPELRLGLIPGWGGIPRLKRDCGNAVVRDLLLTGRSLRASRAHAIGLVSQLVARGQALAVARQVAAQACRFDPATTAAAKRFMKPLPSAELEAEKDIFCELFTSQVVEDALQRFVTSTDARPYLP